MENWKYSVSSANELAELASLVTSQRSLELRSSDYDGNNEGQFVGFIGHRKIKVGMETFYIPIMESGKVIMAIKEAIIALEPERSNCGRDVRFDSVVDVEIDIYNRVVLVVETARTGDSPNPGEWKNHKLVVLEWF